MRLSRISVLFNTDYDAELTGPGVDVSSVEISARSITGALRDAGYDVELLGIEGTDVFEVLGTLRTSKPDLVFNLCESMAGNPCNEPTFVGLLDLFGIPYTGADLLALASCLYKRRSKEILAARGIPSPPYRVIEDVAALAVFSQTAFAQSTEPVSREQRKAETAELNKAGKLAPAGQGPIGSAPSTLSDKTRMERKDTAKADIKAGATKPAGDAAEMKTDKMEKAATVGSDKTRAERKAQTQADIKAGTTQPAGEAANPVSLPPKK